jgi:RNA polymerase sigma-70 factor (ECF subfamily)
MLHTVIELVTQCGRSSWRLAGREAGSPPAGGLPPVAGHYDAPVAVMGSRDAGGAGLPGGAAGPALDAAVGRAQHGDEAAFRLLYRAIQPGLLRYLRLLVGDDAEDVASEAWLQVARDLRGFRGDLDGLRGWVATIGRHRALDHLRQQGRRPRIDPRERAVEGLSELPSADDTAGSALEAIATDSALALIGRLPRDQAEAVLLRVVLGLDATSAAQVLGKRPGAVRTAAHRGLRRLAELLQSGTPPPAAERRAVRPVRVSGNPRVLPAGPPDRPRSDTKGHFDAER